MDEEEGIKYKTEVNVVLKRKRYIKTEAFTDEYDDVIPEKLIESDGTAANLVSSETNLRDVHLPVLDLDFPCRLVKSSTLGHFHLYIDTPMSWEQCELLLYGLIKAGLLNAQWVKKSIKDKKMMVRRPGVKK